MTTRAPTTRLGATAVVLVIAMLAGCDGSGASSQAESASSSVTTASTASTPTTTSATGRTTAQNRRAAARAAARVIRSVPLPDGTRRLRKEPRGWRDIYTVVNYNDPTAYQERWWSVGLPLRDVLEYYVDHHPPGLRHSPGEDPYSDGLGVGAQQGHTDFFPRGWNHWRRFSGPALVLDVQTVGDRTVIHGYTQTSARYARTTETRATGVVTSVDVRRVRTDLRNHRHVQTLRLATPRDARTIAGLVRSFNSLAGRTVVTSWHSCPIMDTLGYRAAFHTREGRLVARASNVYCGDEIQLARDGAPLRITLSPVHPGDTPHAPNQRWYDDLDRALKRS